MNKFIDYHLRKFDKADFAQYNKAFILVSFNYLSIFLLFLVILRSLLNFQESVNSPLLAFVLPGVVMLVYFFDLFLIIRSSRVEIPGNTLIITFLIIFLGASFVSVDQIGIRLFFGVFFYIIGVFSLSYIVSGKWFVFVNLAILLLGINLLYFRIIAVETDEAILRLAKTGLVNIQIALVALSVMISLTRSITTQAMEKVLFSKGRQHKFNALLSEIIFKVEQTAKQIDKLTGQLESISSQNKTVASNQAASLEEISATIEQLINSVQETAHIGNLTKDNVSNSKQLILANEQNFAETSQEILKTREESAKIQEISEKTEILAINASIEISRATSAGFTNIAAEIRKLAEITLQTATRIYQLSDEAYIFAVDSQLNVREIVTLVHRLEEQISVIYLGVMEQKIAFENISAGIIEVSDTSQITLSVGEQLAGLVEELRKNSGELRLLLSN